MLPTNAVLRGISYEIGSLHAVQDLVAQELSIETVNELLEMGVQEFSVFHRPLAEAVSDCTAASLSSAGITGEDVDTVIVITESFAEIFPSDAGQGGVFRQVRNQTFDLFYRLGIRKASIFCATYGGCTNLLQAALLAKTLVVQGLSKNVLLVAAERFPSLQSRLMKEAISIAGDGVATCIVNADASPGPGAFQLDYVSIAPYKNVQPGGDMANLLLEMFRAMKNAAADCYEACQKQPRHFKWIVLGDYNRHTSLTYRKLLGFPPERTFLKNVGRLGHIPFDPLINLSDLARHTVLEPSDPILLFLCGPISCGSLAVKTL